ncbi:MAG: hypothetical protein WCI76_03190, partial [bacterium]
LRRVERWFEKPRFRDLMPKFLTPKQVYLKNECEEILELIGAKNQSQIGRYLTLMDDIEFFCLQQGVSVIPKEEEVERGVKYVSRAEILPPPKSPNKKPHD